MLHSYVSSFEIINDRFGLLKQQAARGLTDFMKMVDFPYTTRTTSFDVCTTVEVSERYSIVEYTREMN